MPTGISSNKEAAGAQGTAEKLRSSPGSHQGQLLRENCPLSIVHLCKTLLASRFKARMHVDVVTARQSFKLNMAAGMQAQSEVFFLSHAPKASDSSQQKILIFQYSSSFYKKNKIKGHFFGFSLLLGTIPL